VSRPTRSNPLHVAHFCTYPRGGAGTAAKRLHRSLLDLGVDSRFFHIHGQSPDASYQALRDPPGQWPWRAALDRHRAKGYARRERRLLAGRPDWLDQFSFPRTARRITLASAGPAPDILHLHWIAESFDYQRFFRSVPDRLPIVWTQHDMNAFTGGCHYSWDCRRFETGCGECFQLPHPAPQDASYANAQIKHAAIRDKNLHVVADSRWIEREARASSILAQARSFRTIHYGLDHRTFSPRERSECRTRLGLDPNRFVVGFGADSFAIRRKGLDLLIAALRELKAPDLELLIFGTGEQPAGLEDRRVHVVGRIDSEDRLAESYSAMDLFVMPSRFEAFGQTALEAMACGTPVLAFEVGGIVDMVLPHETGLLAEPENASDLARQLAYAIAHPEELRSMGARARAMVEDRFKLEDQGRRYVDLYRSLLQAPAS
jgi:glycosyltransferase involved in cell wall biosynthesis